MKSDSPRPHLIIPLAHPRNNNFSQLLHEHIMKHSSRPTRYIRQLDRIVDIRNNAHRRVRQRDVLCGLGDSTRAGCASADSTGLACLGSRRREHLCDDEQFVLVRGISLGNMRSPRMLTNVIPWHNEFRLKRSIRPGHHILNRNRTMI